MPTPRASHFLMAALLVGVAMALRVCRAEEAPAAPPPHPVLDTGQNWCSDDHGWPIQPQPGQPFEGQDAQYQGLQAAFRDNGDGTVSDLATGLMWRQDPGGKVTWGQAVAGAAGFRLAGHDDWRLPTIKELYSLIDFRGSTGTSSWNSVPYLDTRFFRFTYGDATGERFIDSQFCSATRYVGQPRLAQVFGVNFADGRIKGYGTTMPGGRAKTFYCLYVRGAQAYGVNDLVDNGDGTVTDRTTGLMWQQGDSGKGLNWQEALAYAEGLELAGHDDWRLPNVKELESLVDYTRAPDATGSAAISPLLHCTPITNEAGLADFPWYWSSTTHLDGPQGGAAACYVAFGRALGLMGGWWRDVHGAGAQRSDPKTGDPAWFPYGRGPQGDAIRIYNAARAVRGH
jgi:hypothetical protein